MSSFTYEGHRLAYTEFGGGPAAVTVGGGRGRTARSAPATARPLILIHGLLLSQRMHWPLAEDLAAHGNRVLMLDLLRQEPGPGGAVLQGLFFGRVAPHRNERRTFEMPTLVLGHRRDPVHPFSDAGHLAEELPNGRLLEANSLVELRMSPERLTEEIASFLDEVWAPTRRAPARRPRKRARSSSR